MPGIEQVGVMAVVNQLSKFQSDMGKVDKAIHSLIPTSKLLGGVFDWLGGIVSNFVAGAARVLEYALGSLISAAIQNVIGWLKELGAEIIASTTEFQKMEVRLNRMNFNDLTADEKKLGNAMEKVTGMTMEQLRWINKLAASTPFDAEDIARTYTLARSYGFANQEAQDLTYQISEFAAGMGLSGTHIERIIQNFGQMAAAGKITGTEIRDLARGAFVPVNDILATVADNLGITTDQLTKLRQSGMTDAEMFFTAFAGMVEDDFTGAAEDMNSVLMVAIENIKDMARSMLALEVFKGLFEALAVKASGFQQAMFERWDEVEGIFTEIGNTLTDILTDITNLTPSAETMADGVVGGLHKISAWLFEHKEDITNFAKDSAKWIKGTLLPAIEDLWKWLFGEEGKEGAIQKFGKWLEGDFASAVKTASEWVGNVLIPFLRDDLAPVFDELYPLGVALGGVLKEMFGGEPNQSLSDWIHNELIPFIQDLTKWVNENKETIAAWVNAFLMAAAFGLILAGALAFVIAVIGELVAAFVALAAIGTIVILQWIADTIAAIGTWVDEVLASLDEWDENSREAISNWVTDTIFMFATFGADAQEKISSAFTEMVATAKTKLTEMKTDMESKMNAIREMLMQKARSWITKLIGGFEGMAQVVLDALNELIAEVQSGLASIVIGVVFGNPGRPSTGGGTTGGGTTGGGTTGGTSRPGSGSGGQIARGAPAVRTMASAVVNSSTQVQNNYNLTIASSAPTEPIIQDFGMLKSLQGA